jgi:hypothetical protein
VLTAKFGGTRYNDDEIFPFIGMSVSQPSSGTCNVRVSEFSRKTCEHADVTGRASNPNHPQLLLSRDKQPDKTPVDTTHFLSLLMAAMFAGKRARYDILPP